MRLRFPVVGILLALLGVSCGDAGQGGVAETQPGSMAGSDPFSFDASASQSSTQGASCTVSALAGSRAVINGADCADVSHPVVAVVFVSEGDMYSCTGSFITPTRVLTAAHCLDRDSYSDIWVYYGGSYLPATRYSYNTRWTGAAGSYYDAGVVTLDAPVEVTPLPLLVSRAPAGGETVRVFGYGVTDPEGEIDTQALTLRVGAMVVAETYSGAFFAEPAATGVITCYGDSGGPAIVNHDGRDAIIGITSAGDEGCATLSFFAGVNASANLSYLRNAAPDLEEL